MSAKFLNKSLYFQKLNLISQLEGIMELDTFGMFLNSLPNFLQTFKYFVRPPQSALSAR